MAGNAGSRPQGSQALGEPIPSSVCTACALLALQGARPWAQLQMPGE